MIREYYPAPQEILSVLRDDVVLVGSAKYSPIDSCKDIDFVISLRGLKMLNCWYRWLVWDSPNWAVLFSLEYNGPYKSLEFFGEIAEITDLSKHSDRLTYQEALHQVSGYRDIYGVPIRF